MNRIYLDTCVVIYFVEKHPSYEPEIDKRIRSLGSGHSLCYSPLVRMECLVMPLREGDKLLLDNYDRFLGAQQLLELTSDVFDQAAEIRAHHPTVKTPDAMHIAAALNYGCSEYWTNDERLRTIAPAIVKNIFTA